MRFGRTIRWSVLLLGVLLYAQGERLLGQSSGAMQELNPSMPPPLDIDLDRVKASGIDIYTGKHVRLFSDLRDSAKLQEWVQLFDAAVPGWCEFFQVEPKRLATWKMNGFVMLDQERFRRAGLMPDDLPRFLAGFYRGHEMWLFAQKDDYYTRHLLLHEGTHAFMQWVLRGLGSPWYSEGMAELLAVHRWKDNRLILNYELKDRAEAEGWGRVKILRQDYEKRQALKLDDVLNFDGRRFASEVGCYAWSWAACKFFSEHDRSKEAFAQLRSNVGSTEFTERFSKQIQRHRKVLDRDWHIFLNEVEYGYSVARAQIRPIKAKSGKFEVDCAAGWQDTGIRVRPGDRFQVVATGRFQVCKKQVEGRMETWPCEANGITIEYYRGRPLGVLLAGVDTGNGTASGLIKSKSVGLSEVVEFSKSGTLCLRINESPAKLDDNQGTLMVQIRKIDP